MLLTLADIKAGQGLMFQSTTGKWRAINCDDNNYGVTEKTYGLGVQSCKVCDLTGCDRLCWCFATAPHKYCCCKAWHDTSLTAALVLAIAAALAATFSNCLVCKPSLWLLACSSQR